MTVLPFIIIGIFLFSIIALPLGFIFKKLDESQLKAWIPFYNFWVAYRLGNVNPLWSLSFYFLPIAMLSAAFTEYLISTQAAGIVFVIVGWGLGLAFVATSCIAVFRMSEQITGTGLWLIAYIVNPALWLYLTAFIKFENEQPALVVPNAGYSGTQHPPVNSSYPTVPNGYAPPAQPTYNPPPATLGGNDNGGWGLVNGGNNDDNPYLKQ